MVFAAVCRAVYDYSAQNESELDITTGDLLFILDKKNEDGEEDDWWRAKKKADNDEDEEPEGLIPHNYVEEAPATHTARAMFEYTRQTEEELSFPEDAQLSVYDTTDPDWTLVGYKNEFGFVPANYITTTVATTAPAPAPRPVPPTPQAYDDNADGGEEETETPPPQPPRPGSMEVTASSPTSATGPAANLASIMGGRPAPVPAPVMPPRPTADEISPPLPTRHVQFTPEPEEIPSTIPSRPTAGSPPPPAQVASPISPSSPYAESPDANGSGTRVQGGYHLYNVSEMVSVMGKQKKMPVTLGINLATATIFLSPAKKRDGPQREWTAEKLEHYSIEGKHVFLELNKPSKSLDLHAGAKDTAMEIVAALGDMAGAARGGGGFMEIVDAANKGSGKRGHMLYDFMAQGDDEVDVAEGDDVIVLDDQKSEEWWKVRRVKNGKEGVVPSSYVEITGGPAPPPKDLPSPGAMAGRSTVAQNRLEDERATREAVEKDEQRHRHDSHNEVGSRSRDLPLRSSSRHTSSADAASQRNKRESASSKSKTKPDMRKIRTWTDRSGSFKVEAQFIGLRDGKIQLHKLNGVKIAVPVDRMSTNDLNYVESVTGQSLDEDKPLSDLRRDSSRRHDRRSNPRSTSGATVEPRSEYDWFDFFLACGVNPQLCERYSQSFARDSMDESNQEDITSSLLRTLGIKEGDNLKIMKHLDQKFNRTKPKGVSFEEAASSEGTGLLSGPGGVLKNNTDRGRPSAPGAASDVVDGEALGKSLTGRAPTPPKKDGPAGSFENDAWEVKPSKTQPSPAAEKAESPSPTPAAAAAAPPPVAAVAAPPKPPPTGVNPDLAGLSLLDTPLQPQVTHSDGAKATPTPTPAFAPPASQQPAPQQQPQPTGASPAFFQQLPPQQTGIAPQMNQSYATVPAGIAVQQTGMPLQPQATALQQPLGLGAGARPRPQAPSQPQFNEHGQLLPPVPTRPGSAPQPVQMQTGSFAPPAAALQPQLTGAPVGFNPAANPSQSLADMQRLRLQQQMTAQPVLPQPTGFQANQYMQQQQQPQMTAMGPTTYLQTQPTGSPFADINRVYSPPQLNAYQPPLQQQPTGINGTLMPALQPQATGVNGFGGAVGSGIAAPPVPQIPQQFQPQSQFGQIQQQQQQSPSSGRLVPPPAEPLVSQKTGPPPPVSFGMDATAKKLTAQPTGRANLSKATPDNPFGF